MHVLLKAPQAKQHGYPTTQAERDTAEALLATFRSIPSGQHSLLASLLSRWVKARMKNDDWASMNAADAQTWIADAIALGTKLPIEVSRVTRAANGNRKQFYPVTPWAQPRLYRNPNGRYWLRFADTRSRKPRTRRLKTTRRRARTQPSVSWLICALCNALCGAQTHGRNARSH